MGEVLSPAGTCRTIRCEGSETALREAKSTIAGAGPGTGAILRSQAPDLIAQEHATWMVATELVRATTRATAVVAAPFTKGRRAGKAATPRDLSFTATRHAVITSMRGAAAAACLSVEVGRAAHHATLTMIATTGVTVDRHRHRARTTKTRHAFATTTATSAAPAVLHVYGATTA